MSTDAISHHPGHRAILEREAVHCVPRTTSLLVAAVNHAPRRSVEQSQRLRELDNHLASADAGRRPSARVLHTVGVEISDPEISEARLLGSFLTPERLDAFGIGVASMPFLSYKTLLACARAWKAEQAGVSDENACDWPDRLRSSLANAEKRAAYERARLASVPTMPNAFDELTSESAYLLAWLAFSAWLSADGVTITVSQRRVREHLPVVQSLTAVLGLASGPSLAEAPLTIRDADLWSRLAASGASRGDGATSECELFARMPREYHAVCLRALIDVRGRLEERQPGTPRLRIGAALSVLLAARHVIRAVLAAPMAGTIETRERTPRMVLGGRRQLAALACALYGATPAFSSTARRGWWGEFLPSADLPAMLNLTREERRRSRRITERSAARPSGIQLHPVGTASFQRMRRILEATGMQSPALRPCIRDWGALVLLALLCLCPQCDWTTATARPRRRRQVCQFLGRHYEFTVSQGQFSSVIRALEDAGLVHRSTDRADTCYSVPTRIMQCLREAGEVADSRLWEASNQLARAAAASRLTQARGRGLAASRLVLDAPRLVGARGPLVLPQTPQNSLLCLTLGALGSRHPDLQVLSLHTEGVSPSDEQRHAKRALRAYGIAPEETRLKPDAIAVSRSAGTLWIIEVCAHTNPMMRSRVAEFRRMLRGDHLPVRFLTAFPNTTLFRTFAADLLPGSDVLIAGGEQAIPTLAVVEDLLAS